MRKRTAYPTLPAVRRLLLLGAWALVGAAAAQTFGPQGAASEPAKAADKGFNEWLLRLHEASRQRNYVGTFVVSSNTGAMSSARIWHACDADQQVERVENLTGVPRATIRRNSEVATFLPEHRLVRTEKRESLGLFPELLQSKDGSIPEFYAARKIGYDRVAGHDAEVVQLAPRDNLRFGYRVWSEKKTGLVVKLQTLDLDGRVLEQAAFTELQLDAPLKADKLAQQMTPPEGWKVEKAEVVKTSAAAEGWTLKTAVPGFRPMTCYRRPAGAAAAPEGTMQWIFSDGLASVSLFVESYNAQRHAQEGLFSAGATQTMTRRIQDWWLTAVGEVPPATLKAFALGLERRK